MAHTQGPKTGAVGNPAFAHKRRIIVQLLKDWHLPYSQDEHGWALNREVLFRWKKNDVATSHRILDMVLQKFAKASPYYPALQSVFLHAEAGYSDYDRLLEQAASDREGLRERKADQQRRAEAARARPYDPKTGKRGRPGPHRPLPTDGYTDSMHLAENVDDAIDWLTRGLMDVDLFCTFPEDGAKTPRTETKEDGYLRYAAEFDHNLAELEKTHKRARSRAYEQTADDCGVSRNTVERAVKWRDGHANHGQSAKKHRTKKTKGRLRHGAATTEFSYTDATTKGTK